MSSARTSGPESRLNGSAAKSPARVASRAASAVTTCSGRPAGGPITCSGSPSRSRKCVRRLPCRAASSSSAACKARLVQCAAQLEGPGQVIGGIAGLEPVEEPEALLDEGQRRGDRSVGAASAATLRQPGSRLTALLRATCRQQRRQPAHRRRLEHGAQRQRDVQLRLDPRHQARGEQRVPAPREEVVVQVRRARPAARGRSATAPSRAAVGAASAATRFPGRG